METGLFSTQSRGHFQPFRTLFFVWRVAVAESFSVTGLLSLSLRGRVDSRAQINDTD